MSRTKSLVKDKNHQLKMLSSLVRLERFKLSRLVDDINGSIENLDTALIKIEELINNDDKNI